MSNKKKISEIRKRPETWELALAVFKNEISDTIINIKEETLKAITCIKTSINKIESSNCSSNHLFQDTLKLVKEQDNKILILSNTAIELMTEMKQQKDCVKKNEIDIKNCAKAIEELPKMRDVERNERGVKDNIGRIWAFATIFLVIMALILKHVFK